MVFGLISAAPASHTHPHRPQPTPTPHPTRLLTAAELALCHAMAMRQVRAHLPLLQLRPQLYNLHPTRRDLPAPPALHSQRSLCCEREARRRAGRRGLHPARGSRRRWQHDERVCRRLARRPPSPRTHATPHITAPHTSPATRRPPSQTLYKAVPTLPYYLSTSYLQACWSRTSSSRTAEASAWRERERRPTRPLRRRRGPRPPWSSPATQLWSLPEGLGGSGPSPRTRAPPLLHRCAPACGPCLAPLASGRLPPRRRRRPAPPRSSSLRRRPGEGMSRGERDA